MRKDIEILLLELKLKEAIFKKEKLDLKVPLEYVISRLELILKNYNYRSDLW